MLREVSRVRNVLVHEDEINELRDAKDFTELINRVEEDFALILPSFVPRTMIIGDLARKPATAMVFLANLASEIDELDIFDMFNFIARTLAVELAVNQCGDSRGVAVVHMASPEGARAAVREFDGKTVGGQRMILFVAGMGRGTEGTDVREIMARRDSLKR
jgi:hypothetical protein